MKRPALLIILCVIPWALSLAGLGWLVLKRFPPSGIVMLQAPFDGSSAWINPFLPGERVTSPGAQQDGWRGQRIIGDPVYTTARVPGVYDEVEISLEFRPIRQTLVELGLIHNLAAGEIDFRPIWFAPLQDARWKQTTGGYTRDGEGDVTAIWHASTTMAYPLDAAATPKTTRVTLRGQHDFYALPAGGRLSFSFELQDVNRATGADAISIRVFRGEEEIGRESFSIGGSGDKGMGPVVSKNVNIPVTTNGVYHVQLAMNDDVFIRSVTTDARHWVVGPRLVFGDEVGFGTSTKSGVAWTDSRHLVLQTFHKEGIQRVAFGAISANVVRTHEAFPLDRAHTDAALQPVTAPAGDMRLIGDGWFAFVPDAWFAPQPRRLTDASDPAAEGVTTILTPYVRPESLGDGWYRAIATFHLDSARDTVPLALSAPGIITRIGAVDIRSVTLTYHRPPLTWNEWWRVVKRELGNVIRRMR